MHLMIPLSVTLNFKVIVQSERTKSFCLYVCFSLSKFLCGKIPSTCECFLQIEEGMLKCQRMKAHRFYCMDDIDIFTHREILKEGGSFRTSHVGHYFDLWQTRICLIS